MANGRNRGRRRGGSRDGVGFALLPHVVLDSDAFMGLSPIGKAMGIEAARQYDGNNNGRLLLSRAYLGPRGWHSAGFIQRGKEELLAAGLIFETVKGCRPNKASWYALTWCPLDKIPGYDTGAEAGFQRGAYLKVLAKAKRLPPAAPTNAKRNKNASLCPAPGTESTIIVPATGTETPATVPAPGPIRAHFGHSPVPVAGHLLDIAISSTGNAAAEPAQPDQKHVSSALKTTAAPETKNESQPLTTSAQSGCDSAPVTDPVTDPRRQSLLDRGRALGLTFRAGDGTGYIAAQIAITEGQRRTAHDRY